MAELPWHGAVRTGSLAEVDSAAGLACLEGATGIEPRAAAELIERFRYPAPRVELGIALAEIALAAIDVSDGLVVDLGRLCAQSGCGAELELDSVVEEGILRSDFVPRTPPGFLEQVFEMTEGEARVVESEAAVILVRLDAVSPPSEDGEAAAIRLQLEQQASQQLARDVFDAYAADVMRRADPQINQQALQAVHVNFP